MKLDLRGLAEYMQRDWGAPEQLARRERARLPVEEKIRIAVALYEGAKSSCPGWPSDELRQQDLRAHLRLKMLMRKAGDVGPR